MAAVATVLPAMTMTTMAVVAQAASTVPSRARPAARRTTRGRRAAHAGTPWGVGEMVAGDRELKTLAGEGDESRDERGREGTTVHGQRISRSQYQ